MANNVSITIDADAKKAEDKLKQFQANVRKAGLALSAMGAAGAFAIKGFTSAALKQEQAMQVFLNSARNAGTEMEGLEQKIGGVTSALQNKTNFGDEEQLAVLAKMIPVLGSTEKAMAALPAIMDAAATTGRGLREQSETLTKALAGTVHQAESLGIKFDKTATFEERLALITKLTGGAAEATADPFVQLGNATGDLAEKIGEALLPVVVPLIDKIKDFAVRLQTVNPVIIQWGAGILAAATAIGLLGGPLLLILSALPKLILGVKGVTLAFKAFTLVLMSNPIIMILTAVVAAVALFAVAWQKNMGGIRDFTRDIFVKIGEFIQGGVNIAIRGVNALIRAYNKIPLLSDIAEVSEKNFANNFGKAFDKTVSKVDDFTEGIMKTLKGLGSDIKDFIIPPLEDVAETALEGIGTVATKAGEAVEETGDKIEQTVLKIRRVTKAVAEMRSGAATDLGRRARGQLGEIFQDDPSVIAGNVDPLLSAFKIAGIDTKAVQRIVAQEGTRIYGGDTQRASNKLIEALNINFSGLNTDDPQAVADLVAKEIERVLGEHLIRNAANRSF